MATVDSAKATLVNKIDSLTSSATAKDTIFLAKALKEGSNSIGTGSAGQVLKTDSAGTGVEWGADGGLPSGGSTGQVVTNTTAGVGTWQDAAAGGKVLGSARVLYTGLTSISSVSASLVALNFQYPNNSNFYMEISYTKLSATSDLIVMGHAYYKTTSNTHSFGVWDTSNGATVKLMGMDEHNGNRGYLGSSFNTVFPGLSAGAKTFRASPGFHGTRSTSGYRNPNMYNHGMTDTPNNDGNSSYIMILEVEV